MKRNISDLLDRYPAEDMELGGNTPYSPTRIKEITMNKIIRTETPNTHAKPKAGIRPARLLIAAAIAAAGHAGFETAQAVPDAAQAKDNVLYLVMNEQTGHYDIYAKVGGEMALLDDTTVDLSGYVEKAEGKGLSSEDFTAALKAKLESLSAATDEEVAEMLSDVFAAQE